MLSIAEIVSDELIEAESLITKPVEIAFDTDGTYMWQKWMTIQSKT